jgi:hypothetical protein
MAPRPVQIKPQGTDAVVRQGVAASPAPPYRAVSNVWPPFPEEVVTSHACLNPALRDELLTMSDEDQNVRAELASDGSLFDGYHPRMELVHRRNAARLAAILDRYGWPGRSQVGADGAHAAWLIVQHAIGEPALQRRALQLMRTAAAKGEASLRELAMLDDRIRVNEGRQQRYGTQYDWDAHGEMSPLPLEDPEHVDERRRAVGLGPLAEDIRRHRKWVQQSTERPPTDWHARQREMQDWFRARGWRA